MLRIGPHEFSFPVVQAALAGYSDVAMRLIARKLGAQYAIHEVKLDKSIAHSDKVRDRVLGALPAEDHPVGGQIMGADPEVFANSAIIMAERGYDIIDINFGCPVKKVLGRKRGGFLLSTPRIAIEIMRAVRDAVPDRLPVTVKMRRGLDSSAESERNFFEIFDAACELGLDAVTVHGRTVKQRYKGPSSWAFLKRVKRHAPQMTLLGSGDLFTAKLVKRMFEETGVDGVTVARGCIGNPWIFQDAMAILAGEPLPEPPTVVEQGEVIREHFRLSVLAQGEDRAGRLMRKFGIKYTELHPHPKAVRQAFVNAMDTETWMAVLDEWYDPGRDWPPGRRKGLGCELLAPGAEE